MYKSNWAVIVPMANEERNLDQYISMMTYVLNELNSGTVYIVVDGVSVDKTKELCIELSNNDARYKMIWSPENKNVVDAYMRGFLEAYKNGHDIIIEMDAGMSHDPRVLPMFIRILNEGNECAFGSRFMNGGSIADVPWKRRLLSRGGTLLANTLLGTRMFDMTSGYQGFHAHVVGKLLNYDFLSKAHFFQTEVRYLLRNHTFAEVPIHYRAPSPLVAKNAITNALKVLAYYFMRRITGRAVVLK
jgi:dolichol-phosphate mannosyltransferase